MRQISLLDLSGEYALYRDEIRRAVDDVLESQQFIGGPAVGALESALCARYGAASGIAISSGTDALLVSLMAVGVGPGDEVIVPSFSFFATAGVVSRLGARPVFVDIDPRTFNVDVGQVERAMTAKTRAMIVVHLFGQCAEMDVLLDVAGKRGVALIEDAAQAIDATHEGRPAGVIGDLGCLSFYPTKNLGGFGEGGFVFANRADLGGVVRQLRNHGESKRYVHERVGGNFRLDTMKAAILLVKLTHLDDFTARRQRHAERYDDLLGGTPVTTPFVAAGRRHVYHQYSILCDRRDALAAFLRERGVQTGIYYPIPLHLQPCFAHLGYREGSLPVSEGVAKRILSLPCHPMLGDEDAAYVASCIHEFFGTVLPTRRTGAVAGHR